MPPEFFSTQHCEPGEIITPSVFHTVVFGEVDGGKDLDMAKTIQHLWTVLQELRIPKIPMTRVL